MNNPSCRALSWLRHAKVGNPPLPDFIPRWKTAPRSVSGGFGQERAGAANMYFHGVASVVWVASRDLSLSVVLAHFGQRRRKLPGVLIPKGSADGAVPQVRTVFLCNDRRLVLGGNMAQGATITKAKGPMLAHRPPAPRLRQISPEEPWPLRRQSLRSSFRCLRQRRRGHSR